MNFPGGWELVLVLVVVMALFGARRLPDSARALGRSLRIFKAETRSLRTNDERPPVFDVHTGKPLDPDTELSDR